MNITARLALVGACLCATITGCLSQKPDTPTTLAATFVAAKDVNPNAAGRPSPVVVRYYQLRALKSFENATFFDIYDQGEAALGSDLAKWSELELAPGDKEAISLELDPDTQYVGFVVAYRSIEDATWRAHVATPPKETTAVEVQLEKLAIALAGAE